MSYQPGNLTEAFAAAWRTIEIAERAEHEITDVARATGRTEAEIDESAPSWYLVNTYPGDGLRAMRWLARRRFGVCAQAAFAGWLFVYVWDINKMLGRIRGTPGVAGILCDPVTQKPVPMSDTFVHDLRTESDGIETSRRIRRSSARAQKSANPQKPARPRRPLKFERKALDRLKEEIRRSSITYNEAQWAFINTLEPRIRIAVLEQTLRPPTVAASGRLA